MEPISIAIVGGGWRAEYFLRVCRVLDQQFSVAGMLVRDAARAAELEHSWGVPTFRDLDTLVARARPQFAVVAVSKAASPGVLHALAERDLPALAETPPAPDLDGLRALHSLVERGARIQVAEQYAFQPLHAARLAVARSGKLGAVSQAQVSVIQEYHSISLMRKLLGIAFQDARITAQRFVATVVGGPTRQGPPRQETVVAAPQTLAWFDFGERLGVYDYARDQHRSWVRSPRVLVRGERGEIHDTRVRYLQDFATPITLELLRQDAGHDGNMEGYFHAGILLGEQWVYRNPFVPAPLSDEDIAVATCLSKMAQYVRGGPSFYSVAEAAQDTYLALMVEQAVAAGEPVQTSPQPWSREAA